MFNDQGKPDLLSLIPGLTASNVKIRNVDQLRKKLQAFRDGGLDQLQIISDYDLTITKHHVDGKMTTSSFGLLALSKNLPADFLIKNKILKDKFFPIEINPHLTSSEKIPHMVEWYAESQRMFDGVALDEGELEKLVRTSLPELREGSLEMFRTLEAHKVPVLVLSAGLGDVIKVVLTAHGIQESDSFHIVSNFFKTEHETIRGFGCHETGEFIHPFNKNGLGCAQYFKKLSGNRNNVILLGDLLGDASMDDGVPHVENVIKIGFLYGTDTHIKHSVESYMDHFDIVLIDDQTMKIPQGILNIMLPTSNQ